MFLVFIILTIVTMCVTIVVTYFLLNNEDYRWAPGVRTKQTGVGVWGLRQRGADGGARVIALTATSMW